MQGASAAASAALQPADAAAAAASQQAAQRLADAAAATLGAAERRIAALSLELRSKAAAGADPDAAAAGLAAFSEAAAAALRGAADDLVPGDAEVGARGSVAAAVRHASVDLACCCRPRPRAAALLPMAEPCRPRALLATAGQRQTTLLDPGTAGEPSTFPLQPSPRARVTLTDSWTPSAARRPSSGPGPSRRVSNLMPTCCGQSWRPARCAVPALPRDTAHGRRGRGWRGASHQHRHGGLFPHAHPENQSSRAARPLVPLRPQVPATQAASDAASKALAATSELRALAFSAAAAEAARAGAEIRVPGAAGAADGAEGGIADAVKEYGQLWAGLAALYGLNYAIKMGLTGVSARSEVGRARAGHG